MLLSKRTEFWIIAHRSCANLLDCCSCELMLLTGNLCTEFCGSHWPRAFWYFLSLVYQCRLHILHPEIIQEQSMTCGRLSGRVQVWLDPLGADEMVCSDVSDRLGTGPTGPTGPSDGSRNDRIWLARVELLVVSCCVGLMWVDTIFAILLIFEKWRSAFLSYNRLTCIFNILTPIILPSC